MASLKNTAINDTGYLKLPVGTTAQRPSSPTTGMTRWNSTDGVAEMYNGSEWVIYNPTGALGSSSNPASSGTALYNAGITTSGNYWLDGGSGAYEAYVKMDYGGGWINVNTSNSVYSTLLSSGFGTGGSNLLVSGGSGTSLLNAGNSVQQQANYYGCPGANGKSYVDLNSTFASDFSITDVRIKILYVTDNGNVVCGPYWTVTTSSRTIIQGSSIEVNGTCANTPNRYSDRVGTNFTVEFYGPLNTSTRLLEAWTACGGSYTMQLKEVYVR